MNRPTSDRRTSSLAGFVSSALMLAGVFFFIDSACSRGGGSSCGSSECRPSPFAPPGASIAFAAPADGESIRGADNAGKVEVPVELSARGVTVSSAAYCEENAGHFLVRVEPVDVPGCAPTLNTAQTYALTDGTRALTLQLAPGQYTLTAELKNSAGVTLSGLSATTHISVLGQQAAAGASGCP